MVVWKLSGLALAAVLGTGLAIGQASAMPANGLAPAATQAAATNGVQSLCVRALPVLVDSGPALRTSLLQLLCRAAALLALAPALLVVSVSVRAVAKPP